MPRPMTIDFISDIVCPWCVIGLLGLDQALARASDVIDVTLRFQPFELNPGMPRAGQDIAEHVAQKYGASPEQAAASRAAIRDRAAALGFTMTAAGSDGGARRIYNSFDAHRLLHWAAQSGQQAALKRALFTAYFTEGHDIGDSQLLADVAAGVGLDRQRALEILAGEDFADAVRAAERHWQHRGITAVPAVIVDDTYIIMGGQPPETFEKALRAIAAQR